MQFFTLIRKSRFYLLFTTHNTYFTIRKTKNPFPTGFYCAAICLHISSHFKYKRSLAPM